MDSSRIIGSEASYDVYILPRLELGDPPGVLPYSLYIEPALGNPGRARCFLPCMHVSIGRASIDQAPCGLAMNLNTELNQFITVSKKYRLRELRLLGNGPKTADFAACQVFSTISGKSEAPTRELRNSRNLI